MEREETEEKESVRKTEKERHEMKYKVGDKVKVRSDLKLSVLYDGLCAIDEMLEGLVEEELTAEEAIRIQGGMCRDFSCCECPIYEIIEDEGSCDIFRAEKPDKVVEVLKQFKKDHEKKPIEMESVGIVRVIEDTGDIKKCVYEEELTERENPMDAKERVLKEYYQKHAGKFFTVFESICRVKE